MQSSARRHLLATPIAVFILVALSGLSAVTLLGFVYSGETIPVQNDVTWLTQRTPTGFGSSERHLADENEMIKSKDSLTARISALFFRFELFTQTTVSDENSRDSNEEKETPQWKSSNWPEVAENRTADQQIVYKRMKRFYEESINKQLTKNKNQSVDSWNENYYSDSMAENTESDEGLDVIDNSGSNDAISVCGDQRTFCAGRGSCCEMQKEQFGCCPYPDGICCANQRQCCPRGYQCVEWPSALRGFLDKVFNLQSSEEVRCRVSLTQMLRSHFATEKVQSSVQ